MTQKPCARCGGRVGLPHPTDVDCFRELDREIAGAVKHLRTLTKRKGRLLRARIRARQKAIATQAETHASRQKQLSNLMGPKGRLPAPLARRRFTANR